MPTPSYPDLAAKIGREILVSDWRVVRQEDIDRFADATGDHQWIHVDPERVRSEGPFGTTVAHGFYTLSLFPTMMGDVFLRDGVRHALNYGCNTVRFPAPLPSGARIRGRFTLRSLEDGPSGSLKCTVDAVMEIEGGDKPACAAALVFLLFS